MDSDLDVKVKEKFKLFQGVRSQEEDQKIYDKVMDLCYADMMANLTENLPQDKQNELKPKLEQQSDEVEKAKLIGEYLLYIPNYQDTVVDRTEKFLDKVLAESQKKAGTN